jgi:pimeloyl-ACP methyl ester carboxylesterase
MHLTTRLVAAGITGMLVAGAAQLPARATPAPATPTPVTAATATSTRGAAGYPATSGHDRTGRLEKHRVDAVRTPVLRWYRCYSNAECATVRVPLDYDTPHGASTEIAVLRLRARNPKARIGSLFVNPGGPGGLGTELAYAAPYFLGDEVLDRFDVVGFDPRGIGYSANVKCFRSARDQSAAFAGLVPAFPYGSTQEAAYLRSARAVGRGCSSTGRPLTGAMSTAEAARDMELLRRAVGDPKLSYLGFSYGTALGQYYAGMFPDRVRAMVVDGVIDPVNWVGSNATRDMTQDERLGSAAGAYRALIEILRRCDTAGEAYCPFAAGDPVRSFEAIAARLRTGPVVVKDPLLGDLTVTYTDFVATVLSALYGPYAGDSVASIAADVRTVLSGATAARRTAGRSLARRLAQARQSPGGRDFPYDNGYETFSGVSCTDGVHPTGAAWPSLAATADRRAPYFGRAWSWNTAQCARDVWTVRDEDAYRGPFNRRTAAPVLVVGSYWDPATSYRQAVAAARLLPNSRLLSSDNWGHTAYGSSACVTRATDAYLLRGTLPAVGTVCVGDVQPFTQPLLARTARDPRASRAPQSMRELAARVAPAPGAPKQLPPVAARIPATVHPGAAR